MRTLLLFLALMFAFAVVTLAALFALTSDSGAQESDEMFVELQLLAAISLGPQLCGTSEPEARIWAERQLLLMAGRYDMSASDITEIAEDHVYGLEYAITQDPSLRDTVCTVLRRLPSPR